MAIVVSGNTATQSVNTTDISLGTAIDALTGLTIQSGWLRVMPDGSTFTVNGNFTDETGNFALLLLGLARFGTSSTGVATVGKRSLVGGNPVYSGGGTLIMKPGAAENSSYSGNINYLLGNGDGTANVGKLSFYDTEIIAFSLTANARINQFLSNMAGCKFRAINQGAGANQFVNLRIQNGAIFDDNVIENVFQFELHGQPASFARNKFINTYGFINFSTGILAILDNIQFSGIVGNAGLTNNGGLYYLNTFKDGVEMTEAFINALLPSPFAGYGIYTNTNPALHGIHWGKTHRELIKNPLGTALTNAVIYFADSYTTPSVFLPTNTGGAYTQTIKLKRATSTGFATIAYANYYPIKKLICEYNSIIYSEVFSTYDAMPAHTVQQTRVLSVDTNITLSEANAITKLASSFTVNRATNALNIVGNSIIDDIYDCMKVYKTRPIQAQLEYPTLGTLPATGNGDTIATAMTVVGIEYLSIGVKFKKMQANCTANAAFNNLAIIGNVTQATPTNLSGVSITGNLVYNTNTDITVTLTNSSISGTISNSGTGNVKLNLVNSTVNTGTRVTAQYPITIIDANGANFSTQIWVFNSGGAIVEDTGFNSLVASKTVYMPVGGSIRVYSQAYGTISKITNTSATNASLVITHIPETLVDTSLPVVTRDLIASYFSSVIDGSLLYVEVDTDLVSYTPAEVLNGMHYFIVSNGGNFATLSLLANSVGSVQLIEGGFRVYSPFFKGRAKATLNPTNTPSLFITLPLYIEDASGVPGNQVIVRNANGIDIHAALWSKTTANISQNDMNSIAGTTWSYSDRTLNGDIFE